MNFDANADDFTIGVIGAGAMGQGIVQVSLQGGMQVLLFDASEEGALAGRDLIFQRLDRSVDKGRLELGAVNQMKNNLTLVDSIFYIQLLSVRRRNELTRHYEKLKQK